MQPPIARLSRFLLTRLVLLAAASVVALVALEIALRLTLAWLPLPLADAMGTGYVDFGNGIYRFDATLNMERMRPHYDREMFFNGYFWHHHADWMGFRNPVDRRHVDIALIGDSMVYGHGLEEPDTLPSQLEKIVERPVANLGIQGGAMDYEYEILRHDAIRLTPKWVLIFFLNNDLRDLDRLTDADLERFIELPLDDHTTQYYEVTYFPRAHPGNFDWRNFYIVRAYMFFRHELETLMSSYRAAPAPIQNSSSTAAPASPGLKPASLAGSPSEAWINEPPFADDPRMQLAMRFHLQAIAKADNLAHQHGIHFAYVFFAVPRPFDQTYEAIIAAYCHRHGIAFFSLRQTYADAIRRGVKIYLPNDGHLTAAGARLTAEALADHFPLRSN